MIATIEGKSGKIGEVFHKGKVFSIKIFNEDSIEGSFLKNHLQKLRNSSRMTSDNEFRPPSKLSCRLGRSEKESFLILNFGLPSFKVTFKNPTFEKNSGKDLI